MADSVSLLEGDEDFAGPRSDDAPSAHWTFLELLEPWENFGKGSIPLAFRRTADTVELVGAICNGKRGFPVAVLPEDARPPGFVTNPVAVMGKWGVQGSAGVSVEANGKVYLSTDNWSGEAWYWDLGLISFPVSEQLRCVIETLNVKGED